MNNCTEYVEQLDEYLESNAAIKEKDCIFYDIRAREEFDLSPEWLTTELSTGMGAFLFFDEFLQTKSTQIAWYQESDSDFLRSALQEALNKEITFEDRTAMEYK